MSAEPGSRPISNPSNLTREQRLFNFAANYASNYGLGRGMLAWAGGPVPEGVDSVTYVFPDGGEVDAVVEDGFWAMQYLSTRDIPFRSTVVVVLDGRDGEKVVELNTYWAGCHQVTHGC